MVVLRLLHSPERDGAVAAGNAVHGNSEGKALLQQSLNDIFPKMSVNVFFQEGLCTIVHRKRAQKAKHCADQTMTKAHVFPDSSGASKAGEGMGQRQ